LTKFVPAGAVITTHHIHQGRHLPGQHLQRRSASAPWTSSAQGEAVEMHLILVPDRVIEVPCTGLTRGSC
jgi:hypothetical protein